MGVLRTDLPPLPPGLRDAPVADNGYPVPWFVPKGPDGKPNFLAGDGTKVMTAIMQRRCWVCGKRLHPPPAPLAFVGGPAMAINGVSAEPPNHEECAEFAVRACPHLVRPNARRRLTPEAVAADPNYSGAGHYLDHKPACVLVALVTACRATTEGDGILFLFDGAMRARWFTEGRPATRAEAEAALAGSLAALLQAARSIREQDDFRARAAAARTVLPREGVVPQPVAAPEGS